MKCLVKNTTLCLLALALLFVCAAAQKKRDKPTLVVSQTRDARLISASAGGVNFVSGDVKARRADGQEWQSVTVKDDLKSGDALRTGADGRVEILLNPGSYMRAAGSTEIELTDTSLDKLQLRLVRGSVLVEATGYDSLNLNIQVSTPRTSVAILRTGVYRIDVTQTGETVVAVQKGRARVGDGAAALVVKGGKEARVAGAGGVEVAKLDKKQRDDLDIWSRERGRELARINGALASRQTNAMLASYNGLDSMFRADYMSAGVWIQSSGCYTFLPFWTGWRSPYGYGYGSYFPYPTYYYNCGGCPSRWYRPVILHPNPQNPTTAGTSNVGFPSPTTGGGSSTSTGGTGRGGGMVAPPTPAPAPMERGDRIPRERTIEPGSRSGP